MTPDEKWDFIASLNREMEMRNARDKLECAEFHTPMCDDPGVASLRHGRAKTFIRRHQERGGRWS